MTLLNKLKEIKKKFDDKGGDILSYPARRAAQKSIAKSNAQMADMKLEKETRGVEIEPANYTNPVFRARANVAQMKAEQQRRALKGN